MMRPCVEVLIAKHLNEAAGEIVFLTVLKERVSLDQEATLGS